MNLATVRYTAANEFVLVFELIAGIVGREAALTDPAVQSARRFYLLARRQTTRIAA